MHYFNKWNMVKKQGGKSSRDTSFEKELQWCLAVTIQQKSLRAHGTHWGGKTFHSIWNFPSTSKTFLFSSVGNYAGFLYGLVDNEMHVLNLAHKERQKKKNPSHVLCTGMFVVLHCIPSQVQILCKIWKARTLYVDKNVWDIKKIQIRKWYFYLKNI